MPVDRGMISDWAERLANYSATEVGQRLPSHSPDCVGCGPNNPAGLALRVIRTAAGVETVHTFSDPHVGAPGIAHGGAVALVFDDLFGFALYTVGCLAVTRSLTIDYHAPFRLHRPYTFAAQVANREGRRLLLQAEARDNSGHVAGTAMATFVVVDPGHFAPIGDPIPEPGE